MVFFSEKTYWYIQGYAVIELVLFYAVPIAVCLWVIDILAVNRLSGVILVGGLFGFLVEGVLTTVVYEAGLLDPFLPAYFVGWHGMLSMVFGWYLIRKWLIENRDLKLGIASSLFGIFWGIWSLSYRLPESISEFEGYIEAGEFWLPGAWAWNEFAFYTMTFTGMLMFGHWLLGQGLWQKEFSLKKWEVLLLLGVVAALFTFQVIPVVPFGILKLSALILLVIIPLVIQRKGERQSLLEQLEGKIRFSQTLPLLLIPLSASMIYIIAAIFPPPLDLIRISFQTIYTLQAIVGGVLFIWAWVDSVKSGKWEGNLPANP
jgi:hypothetical protein